MSDIGTINSSSASYYNFISETEMREASKGYKVCFVNGHLTFKLIDKETDNKQGWGYGKIDQLALDMAVLTRRLKCHGFSSSYRNKVQNRVYSYNTVGIKDIYTGKWIIKPRNIVIVTHGTIGGTPDNRKFAFTIYSNRESLVRTIRNSILFLNNKKNGCFEEGRHLVLVNIDGNMVQTGLLDSFDKYGPIYIRDKQLHHKYCHFDNRTNSVSLLTKAEHARVHKFMGYKTHRMDVDITSVEELDAFLDFLDLDTYKRLFIRTKR